MERKSRTYHEKVIFSPKKRDPLDICGNAALPGIPVCSGADGGAMAGFAGENRSNSRQRARRKVFLVSAIFLFTLGIPWTLSAQGFEERIYEAYVAGEMQEWRRVMTEMEALWEVTGSNDLLYDLIVAEYGYIAYAIGTDMKKEARALVRKTGDRVELLLKAHPEMARAHALLGSIYGYKIGLDPYKAPVLGLKSFDANARALELDPSDPQVLVEKGHIEFFKPAIFGSDSEEAARIYSQAVGMFEKNPEELKYNWLYLNALRSLADAYIASGQYREADATFKKILRVEPRLKWIRDKEYPGFLEKYSDQL